MRTQPYPCMQKHIHREWEHFNQSNECEQRHRIQNWAINVIETNSIHSYNLIILNSPQSHRLRWSVRKVRNKREYTEIKNEKKYTERKIAYICLFLLCACHFIFRWFSLVDADVAIVVVIVIFRCLFVKWFFFNSFILNCVHVFWHVWEFER